MTELALKMLLSKAWVYLDTDATLLAKELPVLAAARQELAAEIGRALDLDRAREDEAAARAAPHLIDLPF